jgi:hypothetical protein
VAERVAALDGVVRFDLERRDRDVSGPRLPEAGHGSPQPVLGVLTGTLEVKGDQAKALRLSSIIDIPAPGETA